MSSAIDRERPAPQAFGSGLVDRVVHVHPLVAVLLFAPAALVAAAISAADQSAGAFALWALGGYVAWTLFEYWGHRLLFHFEPPSGVGARLHQIIHGMHHDYPGDIRRAILTPFASVPLMAGVLLMTVTLLHWPPVFAATFMLGYLAYDLLHLYLHHSHPRNRVMRRLWEYHLRHHFQDDTRGYGISAPYWDRVFGTGTRRAESARE